MWVLAIRLSFPALCLLAARESAVVAAVLSMHREAARKWPQQSPQSSDIHSPPRTRWVGAHAGCSSFILIFLHNWLHFSFFLSLK